MKRLITLFVFAALTLPVLAKEDWKGKVVDEKGEPVAYANVAILSKADSTVVCGAVTGEDGSFNIATGETDGIMMVAMMGYRTVYLAPADGAVITLQDDTAMLEGAAVTAVMPKTKLTGEGLQTNVRGSVLENAGTANDVLSKTPGIIKGQSGLEVIGKGSPLVYINGRKVTDSSELDRLQSNEIQSVEVITNPGSQYDATVKSVVRIRTVRRQGDGFGFNLYAQDSQSLRWDKGNDPFGSLNANYRTGGVDIFGGINYARHTSRQQSDLEKATFGKDFLLENKGDLLNDYFGQSLYGNAGVNWQLADSHFLGGKVEWGKTLEYDVHTVVDDNVWLDGVLVDKLTTVSDDGLAPGGIHNLGANLYYNGLFHEKLGVDVNLDYYGTTNSTDSRSAETSSMTADRRISSDSRSDGRLYAAKAVLSYPVWKGQLQAGTEETFSRRTDDYNIDGIDIAASSARVVEDNYAGFLSYAFMLPAFGQMSAGMRYEYVHYAYTDAVSPENNISRDYGNWFPTLSYATVIGPGSANVQLMVNYSARTRRPNYANLSSVVRYNSRYIWQSGNAGLQPELSHNVGLMAIWKFISLSVNYARTNDAIMTWSAPMGEEGVVLVQPRNIETPFRNMAAYVNFTPTIGIWNMNYTLGIQPQWLTINAPDPREAGGIRATTFNGKTICFAQLFNTLTVKGGWQFELGGTVMTPGYSQNMYLRNWYVDLGAAVQKTLLKDDSLVLRLEGADLAGMAHYDGDSDFGSHTMVQTNLMDTQRVKFSLRYNFNAAKSKYRGTGAGSDSKSRM
ncbi:MAG: TonB-dependent receptor family protein [Bacteroidales bacterium]|nr:TonB-dependent receptor family protein [Bacteroidales bacterium]